MGDPASFRSDVWAIGVVMHEILFGRRPEWEVTPRERVFRSPVDKDARHRCARWPSCAASARRRRCRRARPTPSRSHAASCGPSRSLAPAPWERSGQQRSWALAALTATVALALGLGGAVAAKRSWWPGRGVVSGACPRRRADPEGRRLRARRQHRAPRGDLRRAGALHVVAAGGQHPAGHRRRAARGVRGRHRDRRAGRLSAASRDLSLRLPGPVVRRARAALRGDRR